MRLLGHADHLTVCACCSYNATDNKYNTAYFQANVGLSPLLTLFPCRSAQKNRALIFSCWTKMALGAALRLVDITAHIVAHYEP